MTAKWKEVSAYTGTPIDEDAPTNFGGQGTKISMPPDAAMKKKKKKNLLDARTKEYKQHQARLETARKKRLENRKASQFSKKIQENIMDFNRESLLAEDNLDVLRSIVKSKQNKPVKMKDGSMKVDLFTASAITKVYDAIKQQSNKEKFDRMLNGSKAQFMKIADFAMSQVKMR
tara:strand:- start:2 stop:523 length:522 start_codon:yes stop_codon:yes gene_type:complete